MKTSTVNAMTCHIWYENRRKRGMKCMKKKLKMKNEQKSEKIDTEK